ncbi:site-specific integrase [Psychromonas sp. RZ22]|uniref:site-specific integrase n=1 Tax=Psychromonas algarum TaxID=2555643 RepID=UPI001068C6E1|nr:site-specific integrase [Psychromonas sp. RZ22]TEW53548.1 site-specific integrase [Psychromonas sp. RZ22]
MASVIIEKRVGKTGNITHRAKVQQTHGGKVIDRLSKTFKTKTLAKTWANKIKKEMEDKFERVKAGIYRPESELAEVTIGELITRYLTNSRISPTIGRTKGFVLRSLLNYEISSILASNLRASDVVKHCEERFSEPTNPLPQTIYHDVTYLKSVMDAAKGGLKVNADSKYHNEAISSLELLNLIGRSKPRSRRPTREELKLMEEHLIKRSKHRSAKIPYGDILQISLLTAMRISEITRIEWTDLDHENKTVIIRDRKDPRSKEGNDWEIPLLGGAYEIIMKQKKDPEQPELIFPYNPRSVTAGWQRVRKKLNISNLRYHDLRREAASRLAEMGLPINIVARITGHKNINILHNIYAQIDIKEFGKKGYAKYLKEDIS